MSGRRVPAQSRPGSARSRPGSQRSRPGSEDELTLRFAELLGTQRGSLVVGPGDDCAVLRPRPDEDLLWTVDVQEEGVDFRRGWLTLEEVGARAVAAALSDLAAMAGRPLAVLLSLGSARASPAGELLELFRGAAEAAAGWGAAVAGGDLTRRESGVGVGVSALGAVPRGGAILRSGARAGDEVWVTGTLGVAAAGLRLVKTDGRRAAERRDLRAVARFARPTPRLAEALWLRERAAPRAALDLSDGLAADLSRLCKASGLGACLDADRLGEAAWGGGTAARRGSTAARGGGSAAREDALFGGEDFELVLAVRPGALDGATREFRRRFGVALTRVGTLMPGSGIVLRDGARETPVLPRGWDHVRPPAVRLRRPREAADLGTARSTGGTAAERGARRIPRKERPL